jgi:mannose-6-phosphate isomerase-like protein (cupin superfamily)
MSTNVNDMGIGPEDLELPSEPGKEIQIVRYKKPNVTKLKGIVPICRSDIMFSSVQIVREGGENNLHSHAGMDGLWFVLKGRVRFYGAGDELIGEFGQHEGVFIPRGAAYWFESAGDEDLEILQVEAFAKGVKNTRTDHKPKRGALLGNFEIFKSDGSKTSG